MLVIDHQILNIETISEALKKRSKLVLSEEARKAVLHCNQFLNKKIDASKDSFYGINTGFGSLCDVKIDKQQLEELQANLVQSHAFGTGDEVPLEVIRLMLLLKIKNLSFGFSGVREALLDRLMLMYNEDCLPVIFQQGSLGASGDLAPLAHLSLPLIGKGDVYLKGERMSAKAALADLGLDPLKLQMKEGIAMLNGTQFSLAYGLHAMIKGERLSKMADMIAAMAVDAYGCVLTPFDARLHRIRPHAGQVETAANIRHYLRDSALAQKPKEVVQDPYSFRCVPQVHGATKDAINYVKSVFETEVNSVTDNPNIFPDTDAILSGGNFHAQPLALPLDFMAIALSELASISERRLYQLIGGKRGLPTFLTRESGLNSGLMIGQYTAASIVSQNKQLCTPASVDSIVSCNGQEDHVSMAANAGTKLYKVVENVERVLAIEFMAVAQALFLRGGQTGSDLAKVLVEYRKVVEPIGQDRIFHEDLNQTLAFLKGVEL